MEAVVVVAIGVLVVVFIASLFALLIICQQRYCYRREFLFKQFLSSNNNGDSSLIFPNPGGGPEIYANNMELDDVRLHPDIDRILSDAQWVDDVTGLIPHCLAILKGCHHLTERLAAATMSVISGYNEEIQQKKLYEISRIAQKISPRVDDVLQSMYPPLDPRLLETRCLSLVLSVTRLSLVIRYSSQIKDQWIDESLDELDNQLRTLREAGQAMLDSTGSVPASPTVPSLLVNATVE